MQSIMDANQPVTVVGMNRQEDGGGNTSERILVTFLSDYAPQACKSFEFPTRQPPRAYAFLRGPQSAPTRRPAASSLQQYRIVASFFQSRHRTAYPVNLSQLRVLAKASPQEQQWFSEPARSIQFAASFPSLDCATNPATVVNL